MAPEALNSIMICMGSSCFSRGNNRNIEVIQEHLATQPPAGGRRAHRPPVRGPLQGGPERHDQRQDVSRGGPHRDHRPAPPLQPAPRGLRLPVNFLNPIFTEKRECQDCYKCVRHCPVKAIKVEGGYASVVPELCILCGHCVEVCPNTAKRVRDDLPQARQLFAQKPRVVVSLAPSYVTEFPELTPAPDDPRLQTARLLRRVRDGPGRATGFRPGGRRPGAGWQPGALFLGLPDRGELPAEASARPIRNTSPACSRPC